MTGIDDDFHLLRKILRNYQEGFAALTRVEDEIARLRDGLEVLANNTYPARYVGEAKDGTKIYGDSGDAPRFARALLDGSRPSLSLSDGYRLEGGRVIPTDR